VKKEEPGRPLLYSTTEKFLQLFGLTGLSGLPTLREFTELTEDSRHAYEMETGDEAPFNPLGMGANGEGENEPPEEEEPNGDAYEDGASLVEGAQVGEHETYARGSIDPSDGDERSDEGDEDGANRREDDELEGDVGLDDPDGVGDDDDEGDEGDEVDEGDEDDDDDDEQDDDDDDEQDDEDDEDDDEDDDDDDEDDEDDEQDEPSGKG
jgi:segregation and condensation protein B